MRSVSPACVAARDVKDSSIELGTHCTLAFVMHGAGGKKLRHHSFVFWGIWFAIHFLYLIFFHVDFFKDGWGKEDEGVLGGIITPFVLFLL